MKSSAAELVLSKLPTAKPAGEKQWLAKCPAHQDRRASLSIGLGDDGRALLRCHAGCTAESVVAAIGLRMVDLMSDRDGPAPKKTPAKPKPTFPTAREAIADLERSHGPRTDL